MYGEIRVAGQHGRKLRLASVRKAYKIHAEDRDRTYQFGDITLDTANMTVKKGGENLFLTPTEYHRIGK